jgi:chromosome segregation ATPase
MTNEELKQKLKTLTEKRDQISKEIQKINMQQEVAKNDLARVERECLDLGIKPSELPSKIDSLKTKLAEEISNYESKLEKAQQTIQQYYK